MNIKVYSTPTCVYCSLLKDYLAEKKITFEAIDVSQDHEAGKAMVAKSGQMGVPVTIIDQDGKEEVIVGFDKGKINELLGIE